MRDQSADFAAALVCIAAAFILFCYVLPTAIDKELAYTEAGLEQSLSNAERMEIMESHMNTESQEKRLAELLGENRIMVNDSKSRLYAPNGRLVMERDGDNFTFFTKRSK